MTREYRRQVEASRFLRPDDVRYISTLSELMGVYQEFLTSYQRTAMAQSVAEKEVSRVSRFLDELLDGEPYSPKQLHRSVEEHRGRAGRSTVQT